MTFPNEVEIKFFSQPEVREFFGARWQPSLGDFFWRHEEGFGVVDYELSVILTFNRTEYVWLPRPDQLIEMLKEKGYSIVLDTCDEGSASVGVFIMEGMSLEASAPGPTPAIALALALMEIG